MWCCPGSIQWVYQSVFTENSWLLRLDTTLMRAVRLNQNNKFGPLNQNNELKDTKTFLKTERKDESGDIRHDEQHLWHTYTHTFIWSISNIKILIIEVLKIRGLIKCKDKHSCLKEEMNAWMYCIFLWTLVQTAVCFILCCWNSSHKEY